MKFRLYVVYQSDESLISPLFLCFLHKLPYIQSYIHTKFFKKTSVLSQYVTGNSLNLLLNISKNKMRLIQFFLISGQRLFNTFIIEIKGIAKSRICFQSQKSVFYLYPLGIAKSRICFQSQKSVFLEIRLLSISTGYSKITDLFLVAEIRLFRNPSVQKSVCLEIRLFRNLSVQKSVFYLYLLGTAKSRICFQSQKSVFLEISLLSIPTGYSKITDLFLVTEIRLLEISLLSIPTGYSKITDLFLVTEIRLFRNQSFIYTHWVQQNHGFVFSHRNPSFIYIHYVQQNHVIFVLYVTGISLNLLLNFSFLLFRGSIFFIHLCWRIQNDPEKKVKRLSIKYFIYLQIDFHFILPYICNKIL